jgi:hypothetical protein
MSPTLDPLATTNTGPSEILRVAIGDIIIRPDWQVRGLTQSLVKQYRVSYAAGANMPPIRLADVKGALCLIDGGHRMEAQRQAGASHIEAHITAMTADEGRWEAANANSTHGERLKGKALRLRFRAYIETKRNKVRGHGLQSYRDIAEELGDVSHMTVSNWVKADYPTLFKAMARKGSGAAWSPDMAKGQARASEAQLSLQAIHGHCQQVVAQSRALASGGDRGHARAMLMAAVEAIDKRSPYKAAPVMVPLDSDF